MSDQAQEVPLIERLRDIPKGHRTEWEIQWFEDGTPSGHALCPIGHLAHLAADELSRLQAENERLRHNPWSDHEHVCIYCNYMFSDKGTCKCGRKMTRARIRELESGQRDLLV